jgi:nucleoside-diphosphate-sugar epimerase
MERILITGAYGQIGTDLKDLLLKQYGAKNILASDIRAPSSIQNQDESTFLHLDVLSKEQLEKIVIDYQIDTIYHLAAILSATGEKNPQLAYEVNKQGLYNVLEVARAYDIERIIWPSSIAAFGPDTPRDNTPNDTIMRPTTMYSVTKVSGELLVEYYWEKYGVDTRSVRFPGIISSKAPPGGGTTDYAVDMYVKAVQNEPYTCFVRADTVLPFMYMPDAVKGLIDLADADRGRLKHRIFNLGAMSFSAEELATSIKELIPEFQVDYAPDYRQQIADSWPRSLDDSAAREEWGWKPLYDLPRMTKDMIKQFRIRILE